MVFEAENGSLTCYAASHFYVPLSGALQFVLCWVWLEQKATKAMPSKTLKGIVYFFSKIHTTTARSFYVLSSSPNKKNKMPKNNTNSSANKTKTSAAMEYSRIQSDTDSVLSDTTQITTTGLYSF